MASIKQKDRVDAIAGSIVIIIFVLLLLFLAPNISEIADKGLAEFIQEVIAEKQGQGVEDTESSLSKGSGSSPDKGDKKISTNQGKD